MNSKMEQQILEALVVKIMGYAKDSNLKWTDSDLREEWAYRALSEMGLDPKRYKHLKYITGQKG
jgi:hypothetical protein